MGSGVVNTTGTSGNDTLAGGLADDILRGSGGNDSVSGDIGNDVLFGGSGIDSLTGGLGSDTFVYNAASDAVSGSSETITDFDATDNNEDIYLNGLLQGTFSFNGSGGFLSNGNTQASFNQGTEVLSIDLNGDASADMEIVLSNVTLSDLDIEDFDVTSAAIVV